MWFLNWLLYTWLFMQYIDNVVYYNVYTFVIVVQLLSLVWLFVTPWTAAHQASLFFTISQSLLRLMSIESMMPSNHPILSHPLLLLPSIFPSIRLLFGVRIRYIAGYMDYNFQNAKHWVFTLRLESCKDHWGFKNFSRCSFPFKAVAWEVSERISVAKTCVVWWNREMMIWEFSFSILYFWLF